MQFRYTLIENLTTTSTVVDDPIGWDGIAFKLERDPLYHGFFDGMDAEGSTMRFAGVANKILRANYDTYGIEADVDVLIEIECNGDWDEIFRGQLNFQTYSPECGLKGCYVEISAMRKNCLQTFNNRLDQKVDLDAENSFDGEPLTPYSGLGFEIELIPKALQAAFIADEGGSPLITATWQDQGGYLGSNPIYGRPYSHYWQFEYPIETISTLQVINNDNFDVHIDVGSSSAPFWADVIPGLLAYEQDTQLECNNTFTITAAGVGTFYDDTNQTRVVDCTVSIVKIPAGGSAEILVGDTIFADPAAFAPVAEPFVYFLFTTTTLNAGDRLYVVFNVNNYTYTTAGGIGVVPDGQCTELHFEFSQYEVNINATGTCEPTPCVVYLINEALSRTAEIITNDCLRVKSDYFGRIDSLPYSSDADGCGSLEVVTNGLKIRQAKVGLKQEPQFNPTFKSLIEGLNAIHNIGMGLEADTERPGFNWLRVEPYYYFYQFVTIFNAVAPNTIKSRVITDKNYGGVKIGYAKWEAEQAGGLQDFHGQREYRTPTKNASANLNQVSNLIASGFAIEQTRRQFGANNKDFRYDDDTFIICVAREDASYIVEVDNIGSPENIYEPSSVYNFRISPLRNAMRWAKTVAQTLIPNISTILKFTAGQANIIAEGENTVPCSIENGPLAENTDIATINYADEDDAAPILYNIEDEFEYPLSYTEYLAIVSNPYGMVEYDCNGVNYFGFIRKLSYKPASGKATFTLIRGYDPENRYY